MKKYLKKFVLYFRLVIIASATSYSEVYAFNYEKCTKGVEKYKTFIFLDVISSTLQYSSSWGDCSMLGLVEHDQKVFITQAYEPLQIDIARGGGEYADAFAEISKCNSLGKIEFKKELQKNFEKIYDGNSIDVEQTHLRILRVMRSDQVIAKNCKLES